MVTQIENVKKLNGVDGSYSGSTLKIETLDDKFKNGMSIFDAPGVKFGSSSTKEKTTCGMTDKEISEKIGNAKKAQSDGNKSNTEGMNMQKNTDESGKSATADGEKLENEYGNIEANAGGIIAKLNANGQKINTLANKTEKLNSEIEMLESQKETQNDGESKKANPFSLTLASEYDAPENANNNKTSSEENSLSGGSDKNAEIDAKIDSKTSQLKSYSSTIKGLSTTSETTSKAYLMKLGKEAENAKLKEEKSNKGVQDANGGIAIATGVIGVGEGLSLVAKPMIPPPPTTAAGAATETSGQVTKGTGIAGKVSATASKIANSKLGQIASKTIKGIQKTGNLVNGSMKTIKGVKDISKGTKAL